MYTFKQLDKLRVGHDRWPRGTTFKYLTSLFHTMDRTLTEEVRLRYNRLTDRNVNALADAIQAHGSVMIVKPAPDTARVVAYALIRHWHDLPPVTTTAQRAEVSACS